MCLKRREYRGHKVNTEKDVICIITFRYHQQLYIDSKTHVRHAVYEHTCTSAQECKEAVVCIAICAILQYFCDMMTSQVLMPSMNEKKLEDVGE